MKKGDLVKVTEERGTGTFSREIPLGYGVILDIKKTDDLNFGRVGSFNLGDNVTVYLSSSGEVKEFSEKSVEVL